MKAKPNPITLLGDQIRLLRQERRLSQEALGELSGMHRNRLSDIENGKRAVEIWTLLRIASALEVTPARLFDRFENRPWDEDRMDWPRRGPMP